MLQAYEKVSILAATSDSIAHSNDVAIKAITYNSQFYIQNQPRVCFDYNLLWFTETNSPKVQASQIVPGKNYNVHVSNKWQNKPKGKETSYINLY